MKDAQKPDHISLNTMINRLREGQFMIPDFQREFEWKPWDIRDLMRSIFLDYYIGSLLLWSGNESNFRALACEPLYGFEGHAQPKYIVLDGQQRLTAMYYAFLAPDEALPGRASRFTYFVRVDRFLAEEYDTAFDYKWGQWANWLLENRDWQFSEHIFPLAVVGQGGWELGNWVQDYQRFWQDKAKDASGAGQTADAEEAIRNAEGAKEFGQHLKDLTEQYQISYIELAQQLEIDKICDIFTQINSKGVQLDTFDLINAMLKPKGLQLKQMWRDASSQLEFVDTGKMNVYILQVMSLLVQGYCSPKYLYFLIPGQEKPIREPDGTRRNEVLIPTLDDFSQRWQAAVAAIEGAIVLLRHPQEFGAISSQYLPYASILPAFAAVQAHVKSLPPTKQLDAQRKSRHWYWASVFLNRYSGSVESTAARDFIDLKRWMDDDDLEPALIQEFRTRFQQVDLRSEVRRGTSVYNGIFNLLVIRGAQDWMTGNVPQHGDLDDHHIIPASKAKELGIGKLINSILNRTPLSASTNRHVISDRLPNQYLPDLFETTGEAQVRAVLESHFISPAAFDILLRDPFTADDFEAFIAERQRTLIEAIEDLLIKERLDLSPQLRELDQRIEAVELGLRNCVVEAFEDDQNRMPYHVREKATGRLEAAARKNAAIDGQPDGLAALLPYCDLRELQAVILGKAQWSVFEARFSNKDVLAKRFDQLAEVRNCIRHSRTVDEITRKEGEAAILWFEQVLAKDVGTPPTQV